jgi:preprotein translocase subunit SecY
LGLLLVYRFGAHVTLPGIDATQLGNLAGKPKVVLFNFDMFTGGAFSSVSFCFRNYALHFASIVVQLMGIAIPYLQNFKVMVKVVEKRLIKYVG